MKLLIKRLRRPKCPSCRKAYNEKKGRGWAKSLICGHKSCYSCLSRQIEGTGPGCKICIRKSSQSPGESRPSAEKKPSYRKSSVAGAERKRALRVDQQPPARDPTPRESRSRRSRKGESKKLPRVASPKKRRTHKTEAGPRMSPTKGSSAPVKQRGSPVHSLSGGTGKYEEPQKKKKNDPKTVARKLIFPEPHKCPVCQKGFIYLKGMKVHLHKHKAPRNLKAR